MVSEGAYIVIDRNRTDFRDGNGGELFFKNGRYVMLDARVFIHGTFFVESQQLCASINIRSGGIVKCRAVCQAPDGFYFEIPADVGGQLGYLPIEVKDVDKAPLSPEASKIREE